MALSSLAKVLPRWRSWAATAFTIEALVNADYPFPKPDITFIGAVVQKYRPRLGRASKAFQRWIDQLTQGLKETLIPALEKAGMVDTKLFKDRLGIEPWTPILEVADFNSLIALSQEFQVPVYALTADQTGQKGAVWDQTEESMKVFHKAFSECADRIFEVTK